MASRQHDLQNQIDMIHQAMQKAGLWSSEMPAWIYAYDQGPVPDVWQWMQYIYLPKRLNGTISEPHYIAPILSPYLNAETNYRHILQLVIELDSISTILEKK